MQESQRVQFPFVKVLLPHMRPGSRQSGRFVIVLNPNVHEREVLDTKEKKKKEGNDNQLTNSNAAWMSSCQGAVSRGLAGGARDGIGTAGELSELGAGVVLDDLDRVLEGRVEDESMLSIAKGIVHKFINVRICRTD